MPQPGQLLRSPPRVKVLEALGAIADGRVSREAPGRYTVVSSEGDRRYTVRVDLERREAYSDDNGTVYRGYVGYPIIAALMLEGVLPYREELAAHLRGIPWRKLNERYKRYFLVEQEVRRIAEERGADWAEVEALVREVLARLSRLRLRYAGSG
ncbi:MAG: hypothetical protein ABWW70_00300 [Thermoproteota archaeon]